MMMMMRMMMMVVEGMVTVTSTATGMYAFSVCYVWMDVLSPCVEQDCVIDRSLLCDGRFEVTLTFCYLR